MSSVLRNANAELVTETDGAVEEFIKKAISDRYPDHKL